MNPMLIASGAILLQFASSSGGVIALGSPVAPLLIANPKITAADGMYNSRRTNPFLESVQLKSCNTVTCFSAARFLVE